MLHTKTHTHMKPIVKTTLKTTGFVEFDHAILTTIISSWMKENLGYSPTKIQYSEDGKKIVAVVDSVVDGGATPVGVVKEPKKTTNAAEGFRHKWEGFYSAVGEILDEQRKRRKSFISYEDLRAELLGMENNRGQKLFVKDGEELPMSVIRHRLAPSQIIRQAKGQKNLRSVKNDKKNGGLSFG